MTAVRWKPARDGFVESHDGRWNIYPLYWECDLPRDDEPLGSLELPIDELKRLMAEGMPPDYMGRALPTRALKTYPRSWPKKTQCPT